MKKKKKMQNDSANPCVLFQLKLINGILFNIDTAG